MDELGADVCVVGAGFAGMSAAWRLREAGRTVVVLEARARVGGRSWAVYLDDGTHVDRGGAWFGPGQDRAYGLAEEMGRPTYPQYVEGDNVFVNHGKPIRYAGTVPIRMNPLALASMGIAIERLDKMARAVPLDRPWDAEHALAWDGETVAHWIGAHVHSSTAATLVENMMTELFTSDPSEVSLLGALHLIHSNNGIEDLLNAKGGHQQDRVVGGTTSILYEMHERLGDAVRLDEPVREIEWGADRVAVTATGTKVTAQAAIVAVPPWLTQRIWWDPPLPRERAQLIQRMPVGQMFKVHLIYDTPFWRNDGLTGQTLDPESIMPLTIDACGPEPPPGVLCALSGGPHAHQFARLSSDERRRAVVDGMVKRFGAAAADPWDYIEQDWTEENWTGGAMITHFPPGVLTTFGDALRAPVGPLHWASTEHSQLMLGTIDGAIRSGERAAREVLDRVL
jgi:monoamine oxidase